MADTKMKVADKVTNAVQAQKERIARFGIKLRQIAAEQTRTPVDEMAILAPADTFIRSWSSKN